ncbi:hypothetical protein DSO57_1013547 [Entomophthora muscae]|uniref:Uncharacterized protein n=1 Tax=Entomophthora muscae TaxID=34485 RepID=A0ACC2RKH3_9FUNG|nr:hypothetical protein DSO57_1013547 [Entomophthora muscae]
MSNNKAQLETSSPCQPSALPNSEYCLADVDQCQMTLMSLGNPVIYTVAFTAHTRVQLDSHRGGRPGLEGHVHNRRYTNQWLGVPTLSMGHDLVGQPQYCDIDKPQIDKVLGGRRVGERRGSKYLLHCWWQIQVMGMEILQVKGAEWFGKDNRSIAGRIQICKFVLSSGFMNGCKE